MEKNHKNKLNLGNPLSNLVGQPFYRKKPSDKKILNEILTGISKFNGTCWAPISIEGGHNLMFNQCPGACGKVWKINIQDKDVASWLVNEINQRRYKK